MLGVGLGWEREWMVFLRLFREGGWEMIGFGRWFSLGMGGAGKRVGMRGRVGVG